MTPNEIRNAIFFFALEAFIAISNAYPSDYAIPLPDITVTIGGTPIPVQYEEVTAPVIYEAPATLTYLDSYQAPLYYEFPISQPEYPPLIILDEGGNNNDNSLLYLLLLLGRRNNCGRGSSCNSQGTCNGPVCCRNRGTCQCNRPSCSCSSVSPCYGSVQSDCGCGSDYNDYYSTRICDGECGPVLSISFTQYD